MNPSDVQVFTLESKSEGTAFFELLPRRYDGACWNADSVYVEEEVFGLIEPIIYESVSTYDHYAFTELYPAEIQKIVFGLSRLVEQIERGDERKLMNLGYLFQTTEARVADEWPNIRPRFHNLCSTLRDWLYQRLSEGQTVTLMGI